MALDKMLDKKKSCGKLVANLKIPLSWPSEAGKGVQMNSFFKNKFEILKKPNT